MKSKLFTLFFFFFLISYLLPPHATILDNKGTIKGRILNLDKNPLYPVAVFIDGTTIGDYNNEQGSYKLESCPVGDQPIVISGIGVKTTRQQVQVQASKELIVADIIVDDTVELNEVVIEGKSEARRQQEQAYAITVLNIKKAYATTAPLNKLMNNISSVRIREDGGL